MPSQTEMRKRKQRCVSNSGNQEFRSLQQQNREPEVLNRQESTMPSTRKRRKTNIMEEFRSISLNRNVCHNNNNNNAGSNCFHHETAPCFHRLHTTLDSSLYALEKGDGSQESVVECVGDSDDENGNSSSIVIERLDDDDDNAESDDDSSEMIDLLSDKEQIERKVMYELALGGNSSTTSATATSHKHPVDAKVEEWIRIDMWRRWLQKEKGLSKVGSGTLRAGGDVEIDDDMFIHQGQDTEGESAPSKMAQSSSLSNMEVDSEWANFMSVDMTP